MRRLLIGSLVFIAATSVAAVTNAHVNMTSPTPRHDDDINLQKEWPCGVANSTPGVRTTFDPGATITVAWDETIDHPGHFRILFAEDGYDFPDPMSEVDFCTPGDMVAPGIHCLADNIADKAGGAYTQEITLPNIECTTCTLQLIQVMTDKLPWGPANGNDIYYECADLVLGEGGTTSTSSTTSTGSGAGGAGATSSGSGSGIGGEGGDEGGGALPGGESGCGCRVAGDSDGTTSAGLAAALGLLAVALRRRRAGR